MMMEWAEWGYYGLFVASFLAATVVPFSSEVIFSAMVLGGKLDPWYSVFVATAGNWTGGMTGYYIGRLGKTEWVEKYLRIKKEKVDKFILRFHRYGDWFVFFSFVPFVGDVIVVAAGFLRGKWYVAAGAMLLGKLVRYIGWMYLNGLLL